MCFLVCLVLVLLPLLIETQSLKKARRAVPVRVHIHGTRGKTSAVKMTAKLLRDAGLKVLAKTTGDAPELIYPDGHTELIVRRGPARIAEQIKILTLAAKLRVDVLVIEGMALQTENLHFSESILQATHMAIVNVREDHAESMGWTRESVAKTLAFTLPQKGYVFFSREAATELEPIVKRKGLPYTVIDGNAMEQSADIAHAVARAVLNKKTLQEDKTGVKKPEPPQEFTVNGVRVFVFDFLSANDTASSELLLKNAQASHSTETAYQVLVFASRSDRPLRTLSFMRWLMTQSTFHAVYLDGSHRGFAYLYLWAKKKLGRNSTVPNAHFSSDPASTLRELTSSALKAKLPALHLYCMGNTHGAGETWRTYFSKQRSVNHAH